MIPVRGFEGRTVAVFGLARTGLAAARALQAGGAEVALWDEKPAAREAAQAAGFTLTDLTKADWSQFAALMLSPGVPLTHPEPHWTVERARAALRRHILRQLEGAPYAGVIVALVIGDQRGIPQSSWEVFNRTGISHLVSISGLHITMIAALAVSGSCTT